MDGCCICVYSHSSYNAIRKLVSYSLHKLQTSMPIYIFTDNPEGYDTCYNFKKIIKYNDSDTYAKKLLTCINQIDEPYILLYGEKDIILNFKEDKLISILDCMKEHNIATVDLHINQFLYKPVNSDILSEYEKRIFPTNFKDPSFVKSITLEYKNICINKAQEYLYSCGPRIWNIVYLKDILSAFPHKTYREIECDEIGHYMNMKGYASYKLGLASDDSIVFAGKGFKMLQYISWLSITNLRKVVGEEFWGDLKLDMELALQTICLPKQQLLSIKLE